MSAEREILNETLPHWIRSRFGRWQVGTRDVHGAISCTEQLFSTATSVEKIEPSRLLPNVQCIHRSHRRIVLRCPIGLESDRTCVVKLILLPGLKRKFWHRRYGLPEAVNLVQAHRCGIRVPQVYSCGVVSTRWKISVARAIVMEDLVTCRSAHTQLHHVRYDRASAMRIHDSVLPLFVDVYHAGCNHIDMHSHNIMLPVHDADRRPALIDFEQAVFNAEPNAVILAQQAGKFVRSCQRVVPDLNPGAWFSTLLNAVGIRDAVQRETLFQRFHFVRKHKLSAAERLRPAPRAA